MLRAFLVRSADNSLTSLTQFKPEVQKLFAKSGGGIYDTAVDQRPVPVADIEADTSGKLSTTGICKTYLELNLYNIFYPWIPLKNDDPLKFVSVDELRQPLANPYFVAEICTVPVV